MDWTDDLDLQDATTAVILGAVEATKSEKIPGRTLARKSKAHL